MQLNYNLKNPLLIITTLVVAAFLFFVHPVLPLLLGLGILFVIFALLKPDYFLYALIFFFPWIGWNWTYAITPDSFLGQFVGQGVIELPLADIVGILALGVWGLNVLVKYFYQSDKTWKPKFPGWIFIVLLLISGILALQNADVWYLASIKYLLRPILFAYVAFFLPVYNLARNPRAYRNILYVALALSVLGVLMGAWSFLGVFEHIHRAHPIAIAGYPFWGLNQNLLGELLISLLPVAALLFFLEKRGGAVARALVNDPAIILADEPTGNLDSVSGQEVLDLLLKLNREKGTTIVVVTHDQGVASKAQRTIRLFDGKIVVGEIR